MDLKNDKELAELSIDELAGYYNTLNEAKNSEIEEAIKAKSSKEEVAKLFNSYKKDTEEQVEKMNAILIEQGLKLKRSFGKNLISRLPSLACLSRLVG